jgi:hypothetical protein
LKYIWDATVPTFANWNTPTRSKPLGKDIFTKLGDYLTTAHTAGPPVIGFTTLASGNFAWELQYAPTVTNWGSSWTTLPTDLLWIEIRYHNETLSGPGSPIYPTTRPQRRNSTHAWYIAIQSRFTLSADRFMTGRYIRSYRAHWNVNDDTLGNGPPLATDYTLDDCPLPTLQCGGDCDHYREHTVTRSTATEVLNSTVTQGTAPPSTVSDAVNAAATATIAEIQALTMEVAWRVAALPYGMSVDIPNFPYVRDGSTTGTPSSFAAKVGGPLY